MKIETVTLKGFRCYGTEATAMTFDEGVTALVGGNGAGKTAFLQALSRLFGISSAQRRIHKNDFHLVTGDDLASGASLTIDVIFSFPELETDNDDTEADAVPEFFHQMAASDEDSPLKLRMMLRANWVDDGTPEGNIVEEIKWVRSLDETFDWDDDCQRVAPTERSSIQLIYIPATRDVHSQVNSLLKGRLWRAARWSSEFQDLTTQAATDLQATFQDEEPASFILDKLSHRWQQVHCGDTDTTPILRLVDRKFEDFVRKADFAFHPDEAENERSVSDLSDGQRSLFHIALTAATLEVESEIFNQSHEDCPFDQEKVMRAYLTILAVEEPENSLSPFFLSRIISLSRDIGNMPNAQVVMSSHSSSILGRIEPEEVRYFRRNIATRTSSISEITLPLDDTVARNYVRLAVRAYPELYFARFVILGEGDSEKLVIPRIAEAMGIALDPSFVPIVPLGGRYSLHFWRLLSDLGIPYATLLDFDIGRKHGGANIVRDIVGKLEEIGVSLEDTVASTHGEIDLDELDFLTDDDLWVDFDDCGWCKALEEKAVFLSSPLDLDFAMLEAFPTKYQHPIPGGTGPGSSDLAIDKAKKATLKIRGDSSLYTNAYDQIFRWYPYLFLNNSKPDSHLTALGRVSDTRLKSNAPRELKALVNHVKTKLGLEGDAE